MIRLGGIRLFMAAVTLVVAAVVVAAIVVLGSPVEQRNLRLDQRRVTDLLELKNAIKMYVEQYGALPKDLATVVGATAIRAKRTDPETGSPYEYQVVDERAYRLCAVFAKRSESGRATMAYFNETGWDHEAGRQCFDRAEPPKK